MKIKVRTINDEYVEGAWHGRSWRTKHKGYSRIYLSSRPVVVNNTDLNPYKQILKKSTATAEINKKGR